MNDEKIDMTSSIKYDGLRYVPFEQKEPEICFLNYMSTLE